jgi:cephalosporin-C deacetylase
MPLFEMPMEKLVTYQGRNPRPQDFDAYWDAALDEMRAVDPKVELAPHPIRARFAECFDLYFTGVRGARVHAQLLRPRPVEGPHPAVVQFHGYSIDAGNWTPKLAYVAAGFTVAALDCRGQGGDSEDVGGVPGPTYIGHMIRGIEGRPEDLLFRQIFLDCAQLAGIVMGLDGVDPTRVAAMGGSQGGGLTLAAAALEPRIARLAPTYPFLCDYRRVWEMDLAKNAYEELCWYLKRRDPQHEREEQFFTRLGYVDVEHLANRIRGRVLMCMGLMDQVCPPSTQFAAYNKIVSEKELRLWPDFGHEPLKGAEDLVFDFLTRM